RLRGGDAAEALGVDLRLAVRADADERVVLDDRMLLGYAVDGSRGDEDDAAHARVPCRDQDVLRAADVDRADRGARCLDREGGRRVHDDLGPVAEGANAVELANVSAQLLDRALEAGVV